MIKEFSLGQVLSVTTGRLLCGMDGIYDILNYMTGEDLMTHQLPRAIGQVKPYIYQQSPLLRMINESNLNEDTWQEWLNEQVELFGKSVLLRSIPKEKQDHKDPIEELKQMTNKPIIEVQK
ncbi:MAG: hypothetical protein KGJ90_06210 [Patescibacteria group bacterium]|nr:hypothetical protein [Patescibacteria group bacterium]